MLKTLFLRYTLAGLLALLFFDGFGQVDIVNETLTTGSLPTGWTQTNVTFTTSSGGYAFFSGSNSVLTSPILDLSGYIGVTLEFDIAKFGSGGDGPITVQFSNDGGITWTTQSFNSLVPLNSTYLNNGPTAITVSGTNVRFRFIRTSSPSQKRLRNVLLKASSIFCTTEPTSQATNITYNDLSSTSVNINWSTGAGGDEYILVAREASPVSFVPIDGTDYSGDTGGGNFSAALDQGSGNKVIYTGTTTSATVTGLTTGATYYFQVFNVCTGDSFNYLTATGTGNDGTVGYTVPAFITDDGCDANNYLESTFVYSGGSPIGDVNLFIAITHTYRSDLQIQIESPQGTIVELMDGSNGGSADNLEVIFDDEAASVVSSSNHTIDGTADQTVTSSTDMLSNFDGEDPNGTWTIRICDDTGGDTGYLNNWSLDISIAIINPEPTNHPTNFSCFTFGSDEIDLIWDDATGAQLPDGYLILWSNIGYGSISNPIDGTPVADGPNAQNVAYEIESLAITGLSQNTDYYFKIFPYTNLGTNIDFKTSAPSPQTACVTDIGPCAYESFSNIPSNNSSYTTRNWLGDNSVNWTATDARTDQTINSNRAILLREGILTNDNPISGGAGVLSFDYARIFSGNSTLKVFVNNVQYGGDISVSNTSSSTFTASVNVGGPITVEIENSGNRTAINNLSWTCYDGCTPTQTILDFYPIEGPAQTIITVIGSGFTAASDVQFGGISSSSFTVVNDTLILAQVPLDGLSGKITVTVLGCDRKSADDFTVLKENDNCGIGGGGQSYATELFISEVYDASSGSLSYIEIFNGTANTVALSAYEIRIFTGASEEYPMSGSLSSGDTYVLRIGSGSSICPGFSVDDDQSSAPGFNENDDISLFKSNVLIDLATTPNQAGYSISRNDDVFSPSPTYNSSEWTVSNSENCNDLGVAPYNPNSNQITINSHPADVDCDELTFTVAATTTVSPNVPTTYTWRYIAPGDLTWSLVSSLNGSNGLTVTGANTPNITITGNTSLLFDYQFYVDMGTGGTGECRKYSNAASYTFDTRAFYRTVSSGDWSDLSIWEMSDTEGGTYDPVCQYPVDRTSDKITIQNGHNVGLDVEIAADWIDICATCTLELEPNMKLTLIDGNSAGPDLIVNGTLIDNGTSGNGVDFLDDVPSWEMGASGTLIKTNTSSVATYRDNYEGGIATIPAESNWVYRRIDNTDISIVSIDMVYPNLSFENNFGSSNYDATNSINVFSGSSSSVLIKGNLNIGMSGSGTYTLRTINSHPDPILIEGSLNIGFGSSLLNEATGSFGTGFEVQSDLDISGTLDLSGGTGASIGVLKLSGEEDMIGVSGATVRANHIVIDKDPGFNLLTNLSFEVEESAEFINGILEFDGDANLFTFLAGATTSSASNTSFVNGRVRKIADVGENFTFPIGDSNAGGDYYQPARIFGQTGQTTIDAQYFNQEHPFAGAYYDGDSNSPTDNQEIGNCDYWRIDSITGEDVRLALKYQNVASNYCNVVNNPELMRIASLNAINNWDITASSPDAAEGEVVMDVLIGAEATGGSYGDFAFQSSGLNLNVLPIELLSFNAKPNDSKVETTWITASEINNDFFTVERSADATLFNSIATVQGAGSSHHMRSYEFTDERPLPGISYYRLRQTDFDGSSTYSDVKAVFFESAAGFSLELAYRNENELNLIYKSISPYILVEIYDVLGKRVYTELAQNYGGRSVLPVNLNRGAYVVRISNGESSDSGKFFW